MPKRVAILQSNYIPWKGYFDIIGLVDEFIIYDEVQYTKNDWRNRNKIKTPTGIQWITIPVYQKNLKQKISETEVSSYTWGVKNWNSLKANYGKATFFRDYSLILEDFYCTFRSRLLSDINLALIKLIADQLDIRTTITNSRDFTLNGDSTEKLVDLCKQTGATQYLTGPNAKNYLRENLFKEEGICVEWMDYSGYKEYTQMYPPFEHGVSIVDLLFNTGPSSRDFMKWNK